MQNKARNSKKNKLGTSGLKSTTTMMVGRDYVGSLQTVKGGDLDDGVKLIFSRQISPDMFPNSNLAVKARTYQKYRFQSLDVTYTSQLPTSINGIFMAYFELDPTSTNIVANKESLLRLVQAHQGSVQRKVNQSWTVKMPIQQSDDFFYTGNKGDERLTKQATLNIYQIGIVTNFEGKEVPTSLDAGLLNIAWKIKFSSPQMSSELSVYDGVSQKDVLRTFKNLSAYTEAGAVNVTSGFAILNERFRLVSQTLRKNWLDQAGIGSYLVVRLPRASTISNSVKGIHTVAVNYSYDKYKTSFADKYSAGIMTNKQLVLYAEQAFQLLKGGIRAAKLVYDVISVAATLFVKDSSVGTQTLVTYADSTDDTSTNAFMSIGSNVVYWDGVNLPRIEDFIEFQDAAHAADSAVTVGYNYTLLLYKLDPPLNKDTIVDASLPLIPK